MYGRRQLKGNRKACYRVFKYVLLRNPILEPLGKPVSQYDFYVDNVNKVCG